MYFPSGETSTGDRHPFSTQGSNQLNAPKLRITDNSNRNPTRDDTANAVFRSWTRSSVFSPATKNRREKNNNKRQMPLHPNRMNPSCGFPMLNPGSEPQMAAKATTPARSQDEPRV